MLSSEQIDKVRLTLQTSGWNEVMMPAYKMRATEAIKALCLAPEERQGQFKGLDDSTLRAIVRETEWMLNVWVNEINVFEMNRLTEERMSQGARDGVNAAAPA
jgi:hypothetical protein